MKKVVVFAVLAMVLVGSIAAQSAAADAQRIVGTWTDHNRELWVFNANGTGTRGNNNFTFGISADGHIRIGLRGFELQRLFMSPDGSRMFIWGFEFTRN